MGTWGLNAVEPGTFVVLNVSLCASSAQLELDVVFGSFHKLIVLITLILFFYVFLLFLLGILSKLLL